MKLDDEYKPKNKPKNQDKPAPPRRGNSICQEVSSEDGESCGCSPVIERDELTPCNCKPSPRPIPSQPVGDYVQDSHYVHTDNNFTDEDKEKLDGIEDGAQVNVQADWDENDTSSDSFVRNKPTIGDGQITLKYADTTVGSFSVNSTQNTTIQLPNTGSNYLKDNFDSGTNPITISYNTNIYGTYPPVRVFNEWNMEIFGDIQYSGNPVGIMVIKIYFNQDPSVGYYILG